MDTLRSQHYSLSDERCYSDGDKPMITPAMLHGACKEQRDIFGREWPDGAEVTLENVRRAQELGLDLNWGVRWFTPSARQAYDEAASLAWEGIQRSLRLRMEGNKPSLLRLKAYDEAIASAWVAAFHASVAVAP